MARWSCACRAVLRDEHGAQDAFQATFLILAQRARSLRVRDSPGPWLHEVAVRVSAHARSASARRARHERLAAVSATAARAPIDPGGDDLRGVLHEEVGRLPERDRAVVVLCDLQGLTHRQAAQQLCWPIGTVKSRQARGRRRLRERLSRRGLAPAAGTLAILLAAEGAPASVPAALAGATTRSATGLAAGELMAGVASASVGALLERGARAMVVSQLRWAAVGLLALGLATAGAGAVARQLSAPCADGPASNGAEDAPARPATARGVALDGLLKKQAESAGRVGRRPSPSTRRGRSRSIDSAGPRDG